MLTTVLTVALTAALTVALGRDRSTIAVGCRDIILPAGGVTLIAFKWLHLH